MLKKIVILGAGGHAKVIIDIIEQSGQFEIVAILDNCKDKKELLGHPVLLDSTGAIQKLLKQYDEIHFLVAIGDNGKRKSIVERLLTIHHGIKFATCVHKNSIIGKNVKLGNGTVVMPGAVINIDTTIGKHCIINSNSNIDHDCNIEDYVSVAPGCSLGGNVTVKTNSALGIGCTVAHNKVIGNNVIVGAQSLVMKNIEDNTLAYGVPAKKQNTIVEVTGYLD